MGRADREVWLRCFHPSPDAASELVCFAHAGGSAAGWHGLSEALSPEVEVLAVQYPGRHDRHREAPVGDLHTLADRICEALGPADRPRTLLGHSMGASLAYEAAVRLTAGSVGEPAALVVSGRRAPSRPRSTGDRLMDDGALVAKMRALGGTGAALLDDEEMLGMILPALRGDYRALASYEPTPGRPLACPVLAVTGDRDTEASVEDVAAWQHHTSGRFRLRVFEGGHFFLTDHLAAVADLVRALSPADVRPSGSPTA
ncbi:thioesterase II family protein [Streptomyces regalis]|uniref:Oleoyl-ACP hydrolase n=1 Tax=Streptomyces regalis TaxID=68262 RepID=A0A101JBD3_9ACTN|nr:alpha/beta fold hydrolase [Streptomyces regalis]KUL23656.1 oleoyl-ACP hydrolase [Streptomyces regalis]